MGSALRRRTTRRNLPGPTGRQARVGGSGTLGEVQLLVAEGHVLDELLLLDGPSKHRREGRAGFVHEPEASQPSSKCWSEEGSRASQRGSSASQPAVTAQHPAASTNRTHEMPSARAAER